MGSKFLKYGAGLIAIYLAVAYATGTSNVLRTGAGGIATVTRSFQGR